jgi:hypothetical protein
MALRAIGVLALLLFFVHPAEADTFDFTFVSLNGAVAGSGTFSTLPFDTAPDGEVLPLLEGYFITSLDGQVNGIPMILLPGSFMNSFTNAPLPLNVPLIPFNQFDFLHGTLSFTLDGEDCEIVDSQQGPLVGFTFFAAPGIQGISSQEIALQVIDTPESGSILFLALGLLGLVEFSRGKSQTYRKVSKPRR